ncbi:MAG: hypothetical protein ACYDHP_09550 [Ferrimicrobium sp.]
MSEFLPVESETASMEVDPVGYMATVLYRAKSWLKEAQSIDDVRNTKAIAVGYKSVIREKEMAFDAQLAATEIVRRCERRVGELVRAGQEEGTVRTSTELAGQGPRTHGYSVRSAPAEFFNTHKEQTDSYAMADASNEDFDQAIEDAKAEGNLSRANVVHKVQDEAKPTPRAKPLTEQFALAVNDLTKATARITRLVDDKRFASNADTITVRYHSDLVRARDTLQGAIDRLRFSLEEGCP